MQIIFVHGWGYDSTFWHPLANTLNDFRHQYIDLGYYGTPKIPSVDPKEPILAVGHSLGTLWLLTQTNIIPWKKLVSINGFSRFSYHETFIHGTHARILARMYKRCLIDPTTTVNEFRIRCGGLPCSQTPCREALLSGLDTLTKADGRMSVAAHHENIWALNANNDPIVPALHSQHSFLQLPNNHFYMTNAEDHLLPLTSIQICTDLIRTVARS